MGSVQIIGILMFLGLFLLIGITYLFSKSKTFEGASASESTNIFIQILRYWRKNAFDVDYIEKQLEMQTERLATGRYNALKLALLQTFETELSRPQEHQFIYEVNRNIEFSQEVYTILENMMNSRKSIYDIEYNTEEDIFLIKYKQVI